MLGNIKDKKAKWYNTNNSKAVDNIVSAPSVGMFKDCER